MHHRAQYICALSVPCPHCKVNQHLHCEASATNHQGLSVCAGQGEVGGPVTAAAMVRSNEALVAFLSYQNITCPLSWGCSAGILGLAPQWVYTFCSNDLLLYNKPAQNLVAQNI